MSRQKPSPPPLLSGSVSEFEEPVINPGLICQYAQGGGKYIGMSSTVEALPSGCYKLTLDQNGDPVFVPQKITTDDLLRLPDSKSDEVIAEVTQFWTLKDVYEKYGFSHKRGWLLHGSPGGGKTSTIAIIIADMVKAGGVVFLGDHPQTLSDALKTFRQIEPNRSLVVIMEDLDAIVKAYGESAILSVLDGETQVENVVFIATTNYPEMLDGRITNRPSRFDKIVKIDMPNEEARKMYIEHKLGTSNAPDGTDLVKATKDMSIAHIKELIISIFCQGNSVEATIARLKKMKVTPKSAGGSILSLSE